MPKCKVEEDLESLIQALDMMDVKKPRVRPNKLRFTPEEDDFIRDAMRSGRKYLWHEIAASMAQATGNQLHRADYISQRWRRVLQFYDYLIPFTDAEDRYITFLYRSGLKWAAIARYLGNKSDVQVKYRLSVLGVLGVCTE